MELTFHRVLTVGVLYYIAYAAGWHMVIDVSVTILEIIGEVYLLSFGVAVWAIMTLGITFSLQKRGCPAFPCMDSCLNDQVDGWISPLAKESTETLLDRWESRGWAYRVITIPYAAIFFIACVGVTWYTLQHQRKCLVYQVKTRWDK